MKKQHWWWCFRGCNHFLCHCSLLAPWPSVSSVSPKQDHYRTQLSSTQIPRSHQKPRSDAELLNISLALDAWFDGQTSLMIIMVIMMIMIMIIMVMMIMIVCWDGWRWQECRGNVIEASILAVGPGQQFPMDHCHRHHCNRNLSHRHQCHRRDFQRHHCHCHLSHDNGHQ